MNSGMIKLKIGSRKMMVTMMILLRMKMEMVMKMRMKTRGQEEKLLVKPNVLRKIKRRGKELNKKLV